MKHRALSILTLAAAISMNTFAASDGKWLPKNAGAYMKQCFADDYDLASSGNYLDDGKVEYVDGRGWTFASPLSWNGWTGVAARFFAYAPYKGDISNAHSVRFSVLADQSSEPNLVASHVMWGNADCGNYGETKVALCHSFPKLTVNLTVADDFGEEVSVSDLSVILSGLYLSCDFDLGWDAVRAGIPQVYNRSNVSMLNNGDMTFSVFAVPQYISDGNIEFQVKWKKRVFTLVCPSSLELDSDRHYVIKLKLNKPDDSGINVGVDGWEDDGEDQGGTAQASPRGAAATPLALELVAIEGQNNTDVLEIPVNPNPTNYRVELHEGWNWISSNLWDEGYQMSSVFVKPIEDEVERVVGFEQELTNDPEFGIVGNLSSITPDKSYRIKMSKDFVYEREGVAALPSNTPVTICPGWNWIGYVPASAVSLSEAFDRFQPSEGDLIKNRFSFSTYAGYAWTGTLNSMTPGEGYVYFNASDEIKELRYVDTRSFASSSAMALAPHSDLPTSSPWTVDVYKYPGNMTMVATLCDKGETMEPGRFVVGAFAGEECRGIGQYVDDKIYIVVFGNSAESVDISFKAYEVESGEIFDISEHVYFKEDMFGSNASPYVLNILGDTSVSGIESDVLAPRKIYNVMGPRLTGISRGGVYVIDGRKAIVE